MCVSNTFTKPSIIPNIKHILFFSFPNGQYQLSVKKQISSIFAFNYIFVFVCQVFVLGITVLLQNQFKSNFSKFINP